MRTQQLPQTSIESYNTQKEVGDTLRSAQTLLQSTDVHTLMTQRLTKELNELKRELAEKQESLRNADYSTQQAKLDKIVAYSCVSNQPKWERDTKHRLQKEIREITELQQNLRKEIEELQERVNDETRYLDDCKRNGFDPSYGLRSSLQEIFEGNLYNIRRHIGELTKSLPSIVKSIQESIQNLKSMQENPVMKKVRAVTSRFFSEQDDRQSKVAKLQSDLIKQLSLLQKMSDTTQDLYEREAKSTGVKIDISRGSSYHRTVTQYDTADKAVTKALNTLKKSNRNAIAVSYSATTNRP